MTIKFMEPVFGHWIKEIRAQRRTLGTMYVSGFEDALVAVDGLYRFLPIDEALDNASSLLTDIDRDPEIDHDPAWQCRLAGAREAFARITQEFQFLCAPEFFHA